MAPPGLGCHRNRENPKARAWNPTSEMLTEATAGAEREQTHRPGPTDVLHVTLMSLVLVTVLESPLALRCLKGMLIVLVVQ